MATAAVVYDKKRGKKERVVRWGALAQADDGAWIEAPGWCVAWYQVTGTLGPATLQIEYDLSAADDGSETNVLLSTTATSRQQQTHDNFLAGRLRPKVSAGDGTTAITAVTMVLKAM